MNCKPGDLAFIWPPKTNNPIDAQIDDQLRGRIVRVVELVRGTSGAFSFEGTVWRIETPIRLLIPSLGAIGIDGIRDGALRPIRDPGDDAKDETLEWLPVPSREKEHA